MNTSATIEKFLADLPRSEKTKRTYGEGLKVFLSIVGENAALDEESYRKFLIGTKDMTPSTQRTYAAAVRALLVRMDVSSTVLSRYTKDYGLRQGKRLPKFDELGLEKLINYAQTLYGDLQDLRDRALILTLVDTGLRIHEICGLKRGDLDWEGKRAVIIGKGDKEAVIRFSDRSLDAIRDYQKARAVLDGTTGKPLKSLPLFARHDKGAGSRVKPLNTGGAWSAFKGRLVEAGVDRLAVRVHDTRHYFCTTSMRASGNNLKLVQELARHENIATTTRYLHLSEAELDQDYNEIFNPPVKLAG